MTETPELANAEKAIARVIEGEKGYTPGSVTAIRSMEIEIESGDCCCSGGSGELEVGYSTESNRWGVLYVASYEVDDFIFKVAEAAFEIASEK